jgi:hypothetical protein
MEWFGALPEGERRALEAAYLAGANPFDADHFRKKGSGYTGFRFFVKKTRGESGP